MMRVKIDWTDGCYCLIEWPVNHQDQSDVIVISEVQWRAYCAHLDQCAIFNDWMRLLDNMRVVDNLDKETP